MSSLMTLAILFGALSVAQARAQEPRERGVASGDSLAAPGLPTEVAARVIRLFDDPATVRFIGPATIGVADTVRASVAVLEGPLTLAGRVEGDLVMVGGELRLRAGASVGGGVMVIGGALLGVDSAAIVGEVRMYSGPLGYRREGSRIVWDVDSRRRHPARGWGDFLIATGKSYNRVEGLPITFGPRIRTAGSNPLRADALAIYRTESGLTLNPDRMGYYIRVEQFIGGFRALRFGATAHSLIDPIEDWQLSDLESGLSTFLLHEDFRDHYERRGLGLFSTWRRRGSPVELGVEARWERHRSLVTGTPWSLTDNADPWRPQPLVGEGDLSSLSALATLDTRSSPVDPSTGWYVRGRVEQALRSDLVQPEAYFRDPASGAPDLARRRDPIDFGLFTTGTIDVRRYNRVDPESRLNFRLLAAGSLDGGGLPPQRQHALGGEGSLPGYPLFHLDCAARESVVYRPESGGGATPFFPRYGCDAFALLQAEYRGKFAFRFLWDSVPWADDAEEGEDWSFVWDFSPDWTVFADAGRGWSYDTGQDEELTADVGLGLLLNRFGVFVAVPVTGGDGVNIFARIGPRF